MSELQIIIFLAAGSIAWAVGGGVSGFSIPLKWVRRILWPVIAGIFLVAASVVWWKVLGVIGLLILVNHLPYGDGTPWPIRVLTFIGLSAPALILNFSVWPWVLVGGGLITAMGWATRKWNFISHKLFEFGAGAVQAGILVIAGLMP